MSRRDRVKQIYHGHKEPWDNLWEYGIGGNTKRERYLRFRALQIWAAWKRDNDRDGETRAQWNNRVAAYRHRKRGILRRIHDGRGLSGVQVTTTAGSPHWGGGNDVMSQFVEPFMVRRGLPIGSGKRTPAQNSAVGGSPNSDHLTTHTTTMARDFPTFSGEDDARALAREIGWDDWSPNSYVSFTRVVDAFSFRFQILWGSGIGHGDHVHVGIGAA